MRKVGCSNPNQDRPKSSKQGYARLQVWVSRVLIDDQYKRLLRITVWMVWLRNLTDHDSEYNQNLQSFTGNDCVYIWVINSRVWLKSPYKHIVITFKFFRMSLVLLLLHGNCKASVRKSSRSLVTFTWVELIERPNRGVKWKFVRSSWVCLAAILLHLKSYKIHSKSGYVEKFDCDDTAFVRLYDFVRRLCGSPTKLIDLFQNRNR